MMQILPRIYVHLIHWSTLENKQRQLQIIMNTLKINPRKRYSIQVNHRASQGMFLMRLVWMLVELDYF